MAQRDRRLSMTIEEAYATLVTSRGRDTSALRVLQHYVEGLATRTLNRVKRQLGEGRVDAHELGVRCLISLVERAKMGVAVEAPRAYLAQAVTNDASDHLRREAARREVSSYAHDGQVGVLDLLASTRAEGLVAGQLGSPEDGGLDAEQRSQRARHIFLETIHEAIEAALSVKAVRYRDGKRVDYERVASRAWGDRSNEDFLTEDGWSPELDSRARKRIRDAFDQRQSRARAELCTVLEAMMGQDPERRDVVAVVRSLVVRDEPEDGSHVSEMRS